MSATLHSQPVLSRTPQVRQSRLSLTGRIGRATYVFQKANNGWLALLYPFPLGKFFSVKLNLGLDILFAGFKIYCRAEAKASWMMYWVWGQSQCSIPLFFRHGVLLPQYPAAVHRNRPTEANRLMVPVGCANPLTEYFTLYIKQ